MTFHNYKRPKDGVHFQYHLMGFTTRLSREHSVSTSNSNPKTCELNHCATLNKNNPPSSPFDIVITVLVFNAVLESSPMNQLFFP